MVKYLYCSFILFFISLSSFAQIKPSWVDNHPVTNGIMIYGIGSASLDEVGYMDLAKKRALQDLGSQISVNISSNSAIKTVETDSELTQEFKRDIFTSSNIKDLELHKLLGVYKSESQYYACYELNKVAYDDLIENRRLEMVNRGRGFLTTGKVAEQKGDLSIAIDTYCKGLIEIYPLLNSDLSYEVNGKVEYLGQNLLSALREIWNNVSIFSESNNLKLRSLESLDYQILVDVKRNNSPVRNFPLKAKFIQGEGSISSNQLTNQSGQATFLLNQVSGKSKTQQIQFSVDTKHLASLRSIPSWIQKQVIQKWIYPSFYIQLSVEQNKKLVFVKASDATSSLKRRVEAILNQKYFTTTNSATEADIVVHIDGDISKGELVSGGLYTMQQYIGNATIKFVDNRTNEGLTEIDIYNVSSLVKEGTNTTSAKMRTWNMVLGRVKRELPQAVQMLNL